MLQIRQPASQIHELLRKSFSDIMEKTKTFDVLLIQTWGKFTQQNMQKFKKFSTKTNNYHSRDHWMIRTLIRKKLAILREKLHIQWISAKFVPQLLTTEQKQ